LKSIALSLEDAKKLRLVVTIDNMVAAKNKRVLCTIVRLDACRLVRRFGKLEQVKKSLKNY
jgi:hypothetical protein